MGARTRYRAKADDNQAAITEVLRKRGFQVIPLHTAGQGFPDLVVAKGRQMGLVEVKAEKGRLTDAQTRFHAAWQGPQITILRTIEEALSYDF